MASVPIENLEDLIRTVQDHPEWRERLLRALLTEEFLALPESHRRLIESHERLAERVDALAESHERLTASHERLAERVDALAESHERLTASHERLAARVDALTQTVDSLAQTVQRLADSHERLTASHEGLRGQFRGEQYERDKVRFAFYIFRGGCDFRDQIESRARAAWQGGELAFEDLEDLSRLDILWRKEPEGADPCLFAVEVSLVIDGSDVQRAADRAAILSRLVGGECRVVPVVIGARFTGDEIEARAINWKVGWILDDDSRQRRFSPSIEPLVLARPAAG